MQQHHPVPYGEFAKRIGLSNLEIYERLELLRDSSMPFRVTEYYTSLIEAQKEPWKSQLVNIVLPPPGKKPFKGRFDPYGNAKTRVGEKPFLQHKYEQTLLIHIDDFCIANCQFCYKVNEIRKERASNANIDKKTSAAIEYLQCHPEIDNVLLTGGDPAAFRSTAQLVNIIEQLAQPENISIVRFATKGLAYYPQKFQDETLINCFKKINNRRDKRINVIAQYNHPAEISAESRKSLHALQEAGVQVYGQPAIVKGVNDSVCTLVELQKAFLKNNIQSYYLVSFMPVKGVEQYAMPLEETFQRVAESKRQLNGLAKKGVLIAPHDWGKLEIIGFCPSAEKPEKIIFKWHEIAMPQFLPEQFRDSRAEDALILDFKPSSLYNADDVFEFNGLPNLKPAPQIS